jgi:hypothetical protein
VPLDGLHADPELGGDLAVALAGDDQRGDAPLGGAQLGHPTRQLAVGRLTEALQQPPHPGQQGRELLLTGVLLRRPQQIDGALLLLGP